MKGLATALLALSLAALPASTANSTASTFGIYPSIEVQYMSYAIGPIILLGSSFTSITWCPPQDYVSISFGSATQGPFWTVGLMVWNISSPPISPDPYIGLGLWMSPYLAGQIRMSYTGYTSVALTIIFRF